MVLDVLSLEETISLILSILELPIVLSLRIRLHGLFFSTLACLLVLSLFSSDLGSHVGENLWI